MTPYNHNMHTFAYILFYTWHAAFIIKRTLKPQHGRYMFRFIYDLAMIYLSGKTSPYKPIIRPNRQLTRGLIKCQFVQIGVPYGA